MKTVKNIILGIILVLALFSCDNPVSLGTMLDLHGPEINFTSPVPRKAVTANFLLEGTAYDESGVKLLLIKVERNKVELPRQWRYSNGSWEISEDSGASWRLLPEGVWDGYTSAVWSVPIDLSINGKQPEDGEYLFSATAWDRGGVSDDNSFKTLILIIDNDPPKVNIINPLLYDRYLYYNPDTDKFDDAELEKLRSLADWRNPEYIGRFLTNSFTLQWSIEDNFNIWSFDLRFYELGVTVDNNPETPLSDDYIYRYHQNLPPAPIAPAQDSYIKPNGSITIPALDEENVNGGEGELRKLVTDKTTIRAVSVCYDAANNVTQEKTLGYFIYWPQADIPWVTFSGDINTPEYYDDLPAAFNVNVEDAFLVYPGRDIKAVAFHAQGVREVTYSLYKMPFEAVGSTLADSEITLLPEYDNITKENPPRGVNIYSTNFSWDFRPPPRSAFYIVEAVALGVSGKKNTIAKALFKVQDISFPDFPEPIKPPALEPFFKEINTTNNSITIKGVVSDATAVDSLCLVWINPQSKEFASQSQLAYFRDPKYEGWNTALGLTAGGNYAEEKLFDTNNPNKVWKLSPVMSGYPDGINPDTQRVEYDFSKEINLSTLNIGIGTQPLKSQVFLLRAENPDNRVTIITYTPQGDEALPVIKISNVYINSTKLTPGQSGEIEKINTGDDITINGTWEEDSVQYLNFNTYLRGNFNISINQKTLPINTSLEFTGTDNKKSGTWTAKAKVGTTVSTADGTITAADLKDTLVIAAKLTDIGNNVSEDGASFLVKSDTLRLIRISSEKADQTYRSGDIDIFLEFNKPVTLKTGRSGNPVLNLKVGSGTATATYTPALNTTQNTRQYFRYTIGVNQNAVDPDWLDVLGLNGTFSGNYWESANYPFTWTAGAEEIRITNGNSNHLEGSQVTSGGVTYYTRRIPIAANSADLQFTLAKGKNIGIDTTSPSVQSVNSSNKADHYGLGSEIIINVVFNEAVTISTPTPSTPTPQLNLKVYKYSGGVVNSIPVPTAGTPKVNDKTVTFSYTVGATETTGDNKLIIDSFVNGGSITDLAGNTMAAYTFTPENGTLNGNGGSGIFVNTIAPAVPVFRALSANNNTSIISNTVYTETVTGESVTGSDKNLQNYYGNALWFAIIGNTTPINSAISTTGTQRLGYLEYSLDNGVNWKKITNADGTNNINGTPFQQTINGSYSVKVRQWDKTGTNVSAASNSVTLNWDPGLLVTYIDSITANGTYTRNSSRSDTVNVTLYFRKQLTFTAATKTLTLNSRSGTSGPYATATNSTATSSTSLSFLYEVGENDNTPTTPGSSGRDQYLDVTSFNNSITALDAQGVVVNAYISMPTDNANLLKYRKEIQVQTGALALTAGTNPVYSYTMGTDEVNVTITFTFNRAVSKKSGNITVTQQTSGYRLPAVLTETQSTRYKNARFFNTYYTKGTNGASTSGVPDTSAKYVLNYGETAVVTPNNTGTNQEIMAYDFLQAESVTLPVSSQDITVTGNTLTIKLDGSNALQVLGATYNIVIPTGLVQDSLSYQWPSSSIDPYTYTTASINRPFVRVDKKVNADRISATGIGNNLNPHLLASYDHLITTTARLDCRTPSSSVRYNAAGDENPSSETTVNSMGTDAGLTSGAIWKNGSVDSSNQLNSVASQSVGQTSGGTSYNIFDGASGTSTHIPIGSGAGANGVQGYVWRIAVRSTGNNTNSDQFEEIAFRTVLTYEITGMNTTQGQRIGSGDQLWIRGGDGIGSSSIPGFPLNWQDDFDKLNLENKRAGIRLLKMESSGTNMYSDSVWRYVTWEISVKTYFNCVLGRGVNETTAQDKDDAWQYGPRQWAYQRAGWTAFQEQYLMLPGKHRWVRIHSTIFNTGYINFSVQFNPRAAQASVTFPNANQ